MLIKLKMIKLTILDAIMQLRYHISLGDLSQCCHIFFGLVLIAHSLPSVSTCSSRTSMPIMRPTMPTISSTSRPNVTFPIFNCPETYAAWYCLNDATCFTVEIQNEILYNCECALGFMGPRCEYKEIDGSYLPTRRRAMFETASIASGATLALFFMLIVCLWLYIRRDKKMKIQKFNASTIAHENQGMDEVDGCTKYVKQRPFGPRPIEPLITAFKR